MTIDLDTIKLAAGGHDSPEYGHCLLEVVSMFAGEPFSDKPQCVCPTLRRFGIAWNDGMRTDEERAQLKPYVPALVGTAGTAEDASRRAWLALDWSVRVSTPAWLDLAGLADHAGRLRALPRIDGPDDDVLGLLRSTKKDAAAARAAAWAAVRVADWAAGWDAAWAAARAAAWDAAWDAACSAAWAAAWDAACSAAWAAAWDAARDAARDAAMDAARAAVQPTVTVMQRSAHELFVAMILAGPHDPDAVAALGGGS